MNKEKYDLAEDLFFLFKKEEETPETRYKVYKRIIEQTGLSHGEFQELGCQNQTVGQLKYRILGLMEKKKINSSHII